MKDQGGNERPTTVPDQHTPLEETSVFGKKPGTSMGSAAN